MVVQHNVTAMNANRMLGVTTGSQSKSAEKLSSGYQINRAADDAAGLSISEKMRKQIRGLDRASTNAQDGVSSVQTAEGALTEVHDMLQRMNELAVQAANGTNSTNDRQSIQDEIDQLTTEIDRVAETTKFNETYLLKGATGYRDKYMVGHDAGLDGTLADGLDAGKTATFTTTIDANTDVKIAGKDYHVYEKAQDDIDKLQKDIKLGQDAGNTASVSINGTTYVASKSYEANTNYINDQIAKAQPDSDGKITLKDADGTTLKNADGTEAKFSVGISANKLTAAQQKAMTTKSDGTSVVKNDIFKYGDEEFTVEQMKAKIVDGAKVSITDENGNELTKGTRQAVDTSLDKNISVATAANKMASALKQANQIGVDASNQSKVKVNLTKDSGTGRTGLKDDEINKSSQKITFSIQKSFAKVSKDLGLQLHVGADADMTNKIMINVEAMSAKNLGVQNLNVVDSTGVAATYAIDAIEDAIKNVSNQRSALGAVQNRLEHTIKNVDNVVENTTAAESRIRDTDMASEMVSYSKNNILAQAGQSMLAQANQSNQGVLSLLG
ncbi:flagellin N-terminal helical domain-containing protein [Butyrivibrio sp. WCE2006]|uniref:flagellin N-terminal helical domain-containing protein n=1 Tax=Butyrivibrio sp. WCE2006 TaxID=1410611 RepID=UPI0005D17BAA|nr:flagellin [Butyrivibrio sp. WCE2006]